MWNEDQRLLSAGRMATGSGLVGAFLALVLALLNSTSSLPAVLLVMVFSCYLFLTGFWGAYNLNLWFRRYYFRWPPTIWHVCRPLVWILGAFLGVIGWGIFEHFLLLLSMGGGGRPGILMSQLLLIPGLGHLLESRLNFDPSDVAPPAAGRQ